MDALKALKEKAGTNSLTFINSYNTFEIESRGH